MALVISAASRSSSTTSIFMRISVGPGLLPEQHPQCINQTVLVKAAFDNISIGPYLDAAAAVAVFFARGNDDDGRVFVAFVLVQVAGQGEAVHDRHFHVGEDGVE